MRKRTVMSGGIVLMVVGLIYLIGWYNRRPDVSLDQLLVDTPTFPTQWNSGSTSVVGIDWQINERLTVEKSFLNIPNARRMWTDRSRQDAYFIIEEHVGNYRSPLLAWASDTLFPLEQARQEEWGNLLSDAHISDRHPATWSYKSALADQEVVLCAEGIPNNCHTWIYRARYGQYIVFVEFNPLPKGSDAETFAQIVAQIDEHISRQLSQ